jgi:DNA-damage-inducible protein J
MTKTAMITTRVEPALKADAEKVLSRLGISTTEAINLFLSQVRLRKGLPFDVKIPNKATLSAMKDAEEGTNLTECKDADDMFKKLGI